MDSDMIISLELAGAVKKVDGLWKVTKTGREMSDMLSALIGLGRESDDKDDGINFDYGAWQEEDKAFDHAAYDSKCKEVDDEARADSEKSVDMDKWMAVHERIMEGVERPPFKPNASYNKRGDGLQVYLCNTDNYVQWLCPGIDVIRAFSDDRIVGFNVWGLSHVVARDGGELLSLPDEDEILLTAKTIRPLSVPGLPGLPGEGPIVPSKPVV